MACNDSNTNSEVKEPLQPPEKDTDAIVVVGSLYNGDDDDEIHRNGKKIQMELDNSLEDREQWTNGLDFILTLVGYAVGVSNLWRFPYLCLRNGGGAFLIPFFFFLFLCGIPLFYLEVCLGQFSGISSMFVWKMCPVFKGIGYGMVIVSAFACIYYNTVLSWVIYYLFNSFQSELPWASCGHWWNTPTCIKSSDTRSNIKPNMTSSSLIMSWPLNSINSSVEFLSYDNSDNNTIVESILETNTTLTTDWFVWFKSHISCNQTLLEEFLDVNMSSLTVNATSYFFTSCENSSSLCLMEANYTKPQVKTAAEEFWQ